ncbi:MAG: RluA family pseudouridine synthase [Thermoguttaceae bacterium]|jgi:23S rRNA pseudouridine1911/1915/1917 synthase
MEKTREQDESSSTPAAMQLSNEPVEFVVDPSEAGQRLDVLLAIRFHDYSRVHLRRVISVGGVQVNGKGGKPAYRVLGGQRISIVLPEIPRQSPRPENIPLEVLYEDEDLLVVNKPAGMVVHPARGHWSGTLAGALQYHFGPSLSSTAGPLRPGIVHRLDRDTSGAILVARTDQAHYHLGAQFRARSIEKEYFALVSGRPDRDRDLIDCAIGFHPVDREKMAILRDEPAGRAAPRARSAQTFYEVLERFDGFAALRVLPKTGRTHQIRVHLAHVGCPVLCDRQYGGRSQVTRREIRREGEDTTVLLARQALHARRLRFVHPRTGAPLEVIAPLPADMSAVLDELRRWRRV